MAAISASSHLKQFLNFSSKHNKKLLFSSVFNKNVNYVTQNFATKAEKKRGLDRKPVPKIEHTMQSIASKGFLRPTQDYSPPPGFKEEIHTICSKHLKDFSDKTLLGDKKAEILIEAGAALQYSVPNSLLHQVIAVSDLISFYSQETSAKTPLDKMKSMDLPPNLHVQYEYNRWHPDETKFQGITAFPESSTLVTGLKYRGKYKGHVQKITIPRE